MDKEAYRAIMLTLAQALTVLGDGGRRLPVGHGGDPAWVQVQITFWDQDITLLFDAKNLYLQGFTNKNGQWFVFTLDDATAQPIIHPTATIPYATDYGTLGLDRNGTISVTLMELANALNTLYNFDQTKVKDTLKTPMWQCAVGLVEALRFKDVLNHVRKGEDFDGAKLDWDRRCAENDANVAVQLA